MEDYDKLSQCWIPYLMFMQEPNYISNTITTDEKGFRLTFNDSNTPVKFEDIKSQKCNIFIGGSSAFGVGATHDSKTIPSLLNKNDDIWINFGGRAFSSSQELILFMNYHHSFENINKIIIFSGINDLSIFMLSKKYNKDLGSIFHCSQYLDKMNRIPTTLKSVVAKELLKLFVNSSVKQQIDFNFVSVRDLLLFIIKKKSFNELLNSNDLPMFRHIENHEAEKEDLLMPLQKNLMNWKNFSDQLGFELVYILQPYATWIDRELSQEEKTLFHMLDNIQNTPDLSKINGIDQYNWYRNHLENLCISNDITFFDINQYFSKNEFNKKWLFVDRIHLTDQGNKICAEAIKKEIFK